MCLLYFILVLLGTPLIFLHSSSYYTQSTLSIRHMEAGGIGYNEGYSTIAFNPTFYSFFNGYCFADARLHVFDNNKIGSNIGLGLRLKKNPNSSIIGINIYYDLRKDKFLVHQIALGLEYRTNHFVCALNGYIPFGPKMRCWNNFTIPYSSEYFIAQDYMLDSFNWIDFETGGFLPLSRALQVYIGAGPYLLNERNAFTPNTWGGKGSIQVIFKNCLIVAARISHDPIFQTKYQGQLSLNLSFPGKQPKSILLPPIRQEIIPLEKRTRWRWNY